VMESLPPQCSGPRLIGWDWSEHEGAYAARSGTRWGSFGVTGTFDGTDLHPTEAVPGEDYDEQPHDDPYLDALRTPCPEPEGGWRVLDPERTTDRTEQEAIRLANGLPGFARAWVDQSGNPAQNSEDPYEAERAMNDPRRLILNVQVTRDVEAAEAAVREVWGGMLCVSRAEHTEEELLAIIEDLADLPGILDRGTAGNQVYGGLVYDDGSIQAWLDQQYGEGTVRLDPALVDID
jgi:hypothetical protein